MAIAGTLAATSQAADKAVPATPTAAKPADVAKEVTVKGTVSVAMDEKGAIKDVVITSADGTAYECSPASECKKLAEHKGQSVECIGHVSVKDGVHHLHITSIVPKHS